MLPVSDATEPTQADVRIPKPSSSASTADETKAALRQPSFINRSLGRIFNWIPSAIVIGGLIGLAWLGHHNDWKLPRSASSESVLLTDGPAWCDTHSVPEEECINCVPGLVEDRPVLSFCDQHGVHGCVLDDPSLAETKNSAVVLPRDLARAARALAIKPRRENLSLSQLPGSRIQFASIDAMQRAGVDVEPVERLDVTESISTAGEIRYDASRTAQVSPPVDGIVRHVMVNVGDWVEQGQILALVDSEKVGRLKSELLASLSEEQLQRATVSRLDPLAQSRVIAGKRLLESQAALQQAKVNLDRAARALRNLGLRVDVDRLRTLDPQAADPQAVDAYVRRLGLERIDDSIIEANQGLTDNWIMVTAPLDGRLVQRDTVMGEVVDRGQGMFVVSDTRTVWLDLRVSAEDAPFVQLGQEAQYYPDGSDDTHRGKIIWISSNVDSKTRTVRVRAELSNENGRLRNESFGRGQVILRDEKEAIVVPTKAIQWDGENTLIFVRDKRFFEEGRPKFFIARSVRTGVTEEGFTEIIAGVLPGEVVASSGSDVLRAQLLKGNLGAGCTCGH